MDAKTAELMLRARELLSVSISEYGDPDEWSDDEAVACGSDGNSAITFGHLARLKKALSAMEG